MKQTSLIIIALIAALIVSLGFTAYQATQNSPGNTKEATRLEMTTLLTQAQVELNAQLKTLSDDVAAASKQLSATGLVGDHARQILADLTQSNPCIIDASTLNLACVFITVEPAKYQNLECTQTEFPYSMFTTSTDPIQTVLSGPYMLTEGVYGSVIMAPIFNSNNEMIGSVSLAFDQSALISATATEVCKATPYVIWASDTKGTMIYEVNLSEIGTNLFTDPTTSTWASLQTFAHQMVNEAAGYGTYEYFNYDNTNQTVTKQAYWATIGIYNAEWRLVITNVMK